MQRKPLRRGGGPKGKPFFGHGEAYVGMISDQEFCVAFTRAVTDFVYLEQRMASVLAVLSGSKNKAAANFIVPSIVSPAATVKMLRQLLEKAEINIDRDESFDAIITEFEAISRIRNSYVHGKWWTSSDGKNTILDASPDPDQSLVKARIVRVDEVKALSVRMFELHVRIHHEVECFLESSQKR